MLHEGHIVLDQADEEKAALRLEDVLGLFNEIRIECGNYNRKANAARPSL